MATLVRINYLDDKLYLERARERRYTGFTAGQYRALVLAMIRAGWRFYHEYTDPYGDWEAGDAIHLGHPWTYSGMLRGNYDWSAQRINL